MESNETQLALQDRLLAWFETNKKQVLWGVVIIMAAGLIASFIVSRRNAQELGASNALSKLTNRGMSNVERAETPEALLKVAADYPNTTAGARAQLLGAQSLFDTNKYPEAKAQFEKFLKDYRDTAFTSQALFGVAACLNAQGLTNEAITAYVNITKRYPNDHVAAQSKLALARLYEAQNKLTEAKGLYEDLGRTLGYNNSSLGSEAMIRMQNLYAKHPELFAPKITTVTSTNAPVIPTNTPAVSPAKP